MKLDNNAIVVRKSRCNHRSNHLDPFNWSGGRLFLTEHRLIFKPHSFNFRTGEESILIDNIVAIEVKYNDFISNKFTIVLRNGSIEEFRVPKRKFWVRDIKNTMKKKNKGSAEDWDINKKTDFTIPKKSLRWFIKVAIQALLFAICVGALMFVFQIFFF